MSTETYLYAERRAEAGAPLLFTFHGTGGDELQFLPLAEQVLPGAAIISPRGDVSEHGAARFFRRTGEGVYDMPDLAARSEAMTDFIRAHIARLRPSRVLGLGYSNGANILASVMMQSPDLFDAAALMHPLIPWDPEDRDGLADKNVLITAGENDPICPAPLTRRLADYFRRQGVQTETVWHAGGHEIGRGEIDAIAGFLRKSAAPLPAGGDRISA
ncbi:MAG: alpha/beta hydrolase [Pseudomonadota bacterium]